MCTQKPRNVDLQSLSEWISDPLRKKYFAHSGQFDVLLNAFSEK